MKRSGFKLTAMNQNGRVFAIKESFSIQSVMELAAESGVINMCTEPVLIRIEPFTSGEDEICDMCHTTLDFCNCKLIEPDPPTHLRLVRNCEH